MGEYPENACVDLANPRGPLHPRAQLLLYYRADVLTALAAAGALASAAPPADWDELEAVLAAHAAAVALGPGAGPELEAALPPHGLCVTMHTTCGRGGDVLAAIAASVVQTGGTAQGYVFDLEGTPAGSAGPELVAGPGWRHAASVLQRLLAYNAPEGNRTAGPASTGASATNPTANATATSGSGSSSSSGSGTTGGGDSSVQELCRAMSRHFLEGRCLVTLDWDVLLLSAVAKTPLLLQPGVLGVAPLPGSRVVLERSNGSSSVGSASSNSTAGARLVPCTPQLCRLSANHDRLYLTPEGQRQEVLDAAAAANGTCTTGDGARVEAAALAASKAPPVDDAVLINRAPYSVLYEYFVYINYERKYGERTNPRHVHLRFPCGQWGTLRQTCSTALSAAQPFRPAFVTQFPDKCSCPAPSPQAWRWRTWVRKWRWCSSTWRAGCPPSARAAKTDWTGCGSRASPRRRRRRPTPLRPPPPPQGSSCPGRPAALRERAAAAARLQRMGTRAAGRAVPGRVCPGGGSSATTGRWRRARRPSRRRGCRGMWRTPTCARCCTPFTRRTPRPTCSRRA